MATQSLLSMFPPVATEQWERTIRETVAGPDYAAKLIWRPEEGLGIRPYYRAEDLAELCFLDARPGEFPFVRGTQSQGGWRIREHIAALDPEDANRHARDAVAAGAEEISYVHTRIENGSDIALLRANLDNIPVHFETASPATLHLLLERLKKHPHAADVSTDFDPLTDLDLAAETLQNAVPGFRPFAVNAQELQEKGAGAIEEIGFTLSAGVDFLVGMQDRGIDIGRAASAISFRFAIGPEFFVEIAKLRAFRMVWGHAAEAFGVASRLATALIHALPSHWNTTAYDRHVNVLRSTTAAISAVLGGADSISIAPFDECCKPLDDTSRRLARNTQLILKHEALLDRVADPLGGSYLIEVLTNGIATRAWKLFQDLETAGGYRKGRAAGTIAAVLRERSKAREDAVASRRLVLTGTNRFANLSEQSAGLAMGKTSSPRASEAFEALRSCTERYVAVHGQSPLIVLAEIGDPKMRSARSQFAGDFLACAGLATESRVFETPEQIATSGADLIVLCSSDAEYPGVARELISALHTQGKRSTIVIAGNPPNADELKDLGVFDFIHLRSNAVQVLTAIQRQLGMDN